MIVNERHAKLLELYKQFYEICKKHNIDFYFTGGSSLGAIRHEGFIPWDDDIDMGILRKDWERLKPILLEELPEHLTYVDYETHSSYCGHITKIVDRDSTELYRSRLADGTPKGQFLELFILDPVPADKVDYHREMFWIYSELMTPYFHYINTMIKFENFSKWRYRYYKLLSKVLGKDKVLKMIEKKIFNYTLEESDYLLLEWGAVIYYYPIKDFGKPRYVKFEDTFAPVPERAAAQFYRDYGDDWMKYPPMAGRMAHVTIGSAHIPAERYMEDIFTRVDANATNKMRWKVKNNAIRDFKKNIKLSTELLTFKINHYLYNENNELTLEKAKELFKEEKFDLLYNLFEEFYGLKKQGAKMNVTIKLSKELQEYAIFASMAYGRLKMANLIVENYFKSGYEDNDKISWLKNNIHLFEEIRINYYDGRYNIAEKLLSEIDVNAKNTYMFITMDIRNKIKLNNIENLAYELDRLEKLIDKYPEDYDLLKIKADLLLIDGKKEAAESIYEEVLNNSDNGIDILEINHYFERTVEK